MRIYIFLSCGLLVLGGCQKKAPGQRVNHRSKEINTDVDATSVHVRQAAKAKKMADAAQRQPLKALSKEIDVAAIEIEEIPSDLAWTTDMPVLLKAVEKKGSCRATPENYQIAYSIAQPKGDVVQFYLEQMELHGWHCWWQVDSGESLLLFKKPQKQCAVSIRQGTRKRNDIVVMQKVV